MKIIPAIDIIDGKVVRLKKGDYAQKVVYHSDPVEVAKEFEDHGVGFLHLVDLDGAKQGQFTNDAILRKICASTNLTVDVGGGIKREEDLKKAFEAGATQVNIGSLAVKHPEVLGEWMEAYGAHKFILSADVKEGFIAINGWKTLTDITLHAFIESFIEHGLKTVTSTDIARDGMLSGPAIPLYTEMMERFPRIQCIASGGVKDVEDLVALKKIGVHGAIIGKALYEGTLPLKALTNLSI